MGQNRAATHRRKKARPGANERRGSQRTRQAPKYLRIVVMRRQFEAKQERLRKKQLEATTTLPPARG